jgi:hypothetical protein
MTALEQPGAEMFFELLDLKCHRRLRHEKLFRRFGETQLAGDGVKDLQSAISHAVPKNFKEYSSKE